MSAFLENGPSPETLLAAVERFERESYAAQMDLRVQKTLDALRSLARHVAGYPGRKNLLWISSSFPIMIDPDQDFGVSQMRNYQPQMREVADALADAEVAVYPMDPAGMQVSSVFQAGTRIRGNIGSALSREEQRRLDQKQAMQVLAEETGGQICVNDNDLGDCIKRAVDDGSSFYEIGYYADATAWHGEFHKVEVKTSRHDAHLAYRHGYYALPEGSADEKSNRADLERASCRDLLTSTAITLAMRRNSTAAGKMKYLLTIDPKAVVITRTPDGEHQMALRLAICTFDSKGKALRFMQQPMDWKFTAKEYEELRAKRAIFDSIELPQDPSIAMVRVAVQDTATGRVGSVNLSLQQTRAEGNFGEKLAPAAH